MSISLSASRLDLIYRSIILTKFFTKGWGDVDKLKRIFKLRKIVSNKEQCNRLVRKNYDIKLGPAIESSGLYTVHEGSFISPMVEYIGDLIPKESHEAKFQMILPKKWKHSKLKPVVIQLAGTGDHYFGRRRFLMARPLIKESCVASVLLENPFYGYRKPNDQKRSALRNVSDVFIMGGCLILESIALLNWLVDDRQMGPVGVTGISMGGHNAALSGASWDRPCSIIPCLSWTTASKSFTEGVMREAVSWDVLEAEFSLYDQGCVSELSQMIHSPEISKDELFRAGKQFAKDYPNAISALNQGKVPNSSSPQSINQDTINFMRGIMDECTHLGNFSAPVDPSLAFFVTASRDGYVPQNGSIPVTKMWEGCTHRNLPNYGHVSAILFKTDVFRKAITDSLDLNARKYYNCNLYDDPTKVDKQNAEQNQVTN